MKRKTKRILNVVLGVLVAVATITGIVALVNHLRADEDGFEKVNLTYTIGELDENGKPQESTLSMYSNVIEDFDEIKLTLDFENDIKYQLYYYDANDEFVSSSEVFTKNSSHVSEDASNRIRVVITVVTDDKDFELNIFNKYKYSSQLIVEVKAIEEVEDVKELIEVQVQTSGPGFVDGSNDIKLKYYDGITWEEFMELNVDLIASNNSFDEDGYLTNGTGHWYSDADTTNKISKNDLVTTDWNGTSYLVCIFYGN